MATRSKPEDLDDSLAKMPPPVPDGTEYRIGLSRRIDDLLGARRIRAETDHSPIALSENAEQPNDPPPSQPPPPVPGGTEHISRGAKPPATK